MSLSVTLQTNNRRHEQQNIKNNQKDQSNPYFIIGGGYWNSYNTLVNIKIPDDPYLIGTFHYYDPYEFTHKWRGTWGTQEDMDTVVRVLILLRVGLTETISRYILENLP